MRMIEEAREGDKNKGRKVRSGETTDGQAHTQAHIHTQRDREWKLGGREGERRIRREERDTADPQI